METTVRYIGLDSESDRNREMDEWLQRFDFDWARVPGVSVSNALDIRNYDSEKRRRRFGYDLLPQEIGCFLAHRNCWRECADDNRLMLILESDAKANNGVDLPLILEHISQVHTKFDLVRMQATFPRNEVFGKKIRELTPGFALYQCIGDPMGAVAYVVTPNAARMLVESSETFFQPVDVFLGSTWMHRLRYRTVKPYLFGLSDHPSSIGGRKRPKQGVFDRLKIESNRFLDDVRRITYMPYDYFR